MLLMQENSGRSVQGAAKYSVEGKRIVIATAPREGPTGHVPQDVGEMREGHKHDTFTWVSRVKYNDILFKCSYPALSSMRSR